MTKLITQILNLIEKLPHASEEVLLLVLMMFFIIFLVSIIWSCTTIIQTIANTIQEVFKGVSGIIIALLQMGTQLLKSLVKILEVYTKNRKEDRNNKKRSQAQVSKQRHQLGNKKGHQKRKTSPSPSKHGDVNSLKWC